MSEQSEQTEQSEPTSVHDDARPLSRQILALAVPALGALVAEPLFLLADTAIIGHLGTAELAGVGLATTVLHTATGLLIFLAYSTTPAVARLVGSGRMADALARGRDGIWLGVLLGALLGLVGWLTAPGLIAVLGADPATALHGHAVDYLRYSMFGLPAMLGVLAATGVLRGLQDTRTPLVVAGVGFGINIATNFLFVYGFGWGVAGSAAGTSAIQWCMLLAFLGVIVGRVRSDQLTGLSWRPRWSGIRATAQFGSWLLVRNAAMRAAILATVLMATWMGTTTLAAHQLVFIVYSTLAFALDALAIAAQALIGRELGASREATARELTRTMIRWSLWFGVITGVVLAALAWVLPAGFTPDPEVRAAATAGLLVIAVTQPLAGYVFVLDGVLMGAGDARYLALASVVNLVVYLPGLALLAWWLTADSGGDGGISALSTPALVGLLWLGFSGLYLAARGVTLWWRIRGDKWIRLGAEHL
ncbi:MATE family efflux transporter [Citricoccus sp. NR2]|uniref:MATE family efflux transporter n=1 Tax=Citricoccus sp. NR2 TaxID=3004095 RepID=UPI003FA42C6D